MKRITIFIFGCVMFWSGLSDVCFSESRNEKVLSFREYFFAYPDAMPGDYIYRTGRVYHARETSSLIDFNPISTLSQPQKNDTTSDDGAKSGDVSLTVSIKELARQIFNHAEEDISEDYTVVITTFVNLDELYKTSSLGRFISEQLMSEFQQSGVEVIEIRKSPSLMISRNNGEYALSRDMEELDFVHSVQAVLVGTYTISAGKIFLNARLLDIKEGKVLSTGSLAFAIDPVTRDFLMNERGRQGSGREIQVRS
ncbi:FlgO family outer membrane protein [Thermodesulfobacteriota bacterium]